MVFLLNAMGKLEPITSRTNLSDLYPVSGVAV